MTGRDNAAVIPLLVRAMTDYLACPCRYLPPQQDDSGVLAAWEEARRRGDREGFVPVLVVVTRGLWEELRINACGEEGEDPWGFDPAAVAAYRRKLLDRRPAAAQEVLALYQGYCPAYLREWLQTPAPSALPAGEPRTAPWSHRSCTTGETHPLLLAEIPTGRAWEVFAWLPFGGWNHCPDTPALMAVARHWRERYGAVPAVVSQDTLELILPAPAGKEAAWALAKEHSILCPDALDTDAEAPLQKLAGELAASTVWSFWWD